MVGMENHERARLRSRGFFYSCAGDDGRLGAFFIDLDHGVLLDKGQVSGVGGHGLEVGRSAEGARHAHRGEDVIQIDMIPGLETGKPEFHFAAHHVVMPVCFLQGRDDVRDRVFGLRQENGHGESTVAVRKCDGLEDIILIVKVFMGPPHHLDRSRPAGFIHELLLLRVGRLEFVDPLALEVHCIEQVGEHVGIDFVQDLGNQAVGVVGAPAVDGLERSGAVGEVQVGDFGVVVFPHGGLVGVQQRPAVIHEEGVGHREGGLLVQLRQLREHRPAEFVHSVSLPGAVAENVADFIGRRSLRPVQNHSKQDLHAERGDDEIPFLFGVDPVDEFEGERFALADELGGAGGEIQGFVSIVGIVVGGLLAGSEKGQERGEEDEVFHGRGFGYIIRGCCKSCTRGFEFYV